MINWFKVWVIAAYSSEKIKSMTFGEFMSEVRKVEIKK